METMVTYFTLYTDRVRIWSDSGLIRLESVLSQVSQTPNNPGAVMSRVRFLAGRSRLPPIQFNFPFHFSTPTKTCSSMHMQSSYPCSNKTHLWSLLPQRNQTLCYSHPFATGTETYCHPKHSLYSYLPQDPSLLIYWQRNSHYYFVCKHL